MTRQTMFRAALLALPLTAALLYIALNWYRIEPETVWERDFLRRIVHLIRSGTALAPGELAKIYEMEARVPAAEESRKR